MSDESFERETHNTVEMLYQTCGLGETFYLLTFLPEDQPLHQLKK